MTKTDRKYITFLVAATVVFLVAQFFTPQPIDWTPSYSKDRAIPYGSVLVYRFLPAVFPGQTILSVDRSIYEVLEEPPVTPSNYLFVAPTFGPEDASVQRLLSYVDAGNQVFIAAESFGGLLADTLKLGTRAEQFLSAMMPGERVERDSVTLHLLNPRLASPDPFRYKVRTVNHHFTRFDTARTTVLGESLMEGRAPEVNYIKVAWGTGTFWLSTVPRAFTNYNMVLGNNAGYVFRALSYLPVQPALWDEYFKLGRDMEPQTPLRVVLSRPALRWAYGLALGSLLLFIAFRARRRQRIIPIVKPPRNTTLEFVETVGRFYYQRGDHRDLAAKKIAFFEDYLRTVLNVDTHQDGADLVGAVARRSGVDEADVADLLAAVARLRAQPRVAPHELMAFHARVEAFYAEAGMSKE